MRGPTEVGHYDESMTLEVPFPEFLATVHRVLGISDVYIVKHARGTLVTAARPEQNTVIAAVNPAGVEPTKATIEEQGALCHYGSWFDPESPAMASSHVATFIGAVGYRSSETIPGVWVDAYEALPTQVQVLRAMYEEFRGTGEIGDLSFEDFVSTAHPNVVIVSPTEIQAFIESKLSC